MSEGDALTFVFGKPHVPYGLAAVMVHPALPPPGCPPDWFSSDPGSLSWERHWRACRRDLGLHRVAVRMAPRTLHRELAALIKQWQRLEAEAAPLRAGIAREEELARSQSLGTARHHYALHCLGSSLAPLAAEQDGLVLAIKRVVSQGTSTRAARQIIGGPVSPEFLERRRALFNRLGDEAARAILGEGDIEHQFRTVQAVQEESEALVGRIFLARLAFDAAAAEASAIKREREFRAERSIFHETAGQAAVRSGVAETELQKLQQRLAELVATADETGFWDPSTKVRDALEGAR